jgi:hypothetical protein
VVYWPGQQELARRTLQAALAPLPLPGLPRQLGPVRGTIFLAPTPEVFDSLTRGGVPGWAAGVAIPGLRMIVLPVYATNRSRFEDPIVTLRHELAHLALNAYLPRPIPRWFDEGYATWVSGGWDAGSGWQIRMAFLRGTAPPLDSITLGWPRGQQQARLTYLLSASAVEYMAARGGEEGFRALLTAWRELGDLDSAIRSTYLMTLGQFEEEWRRMVRRRYGWLLAVSQTGVFWAVMAVLFVLFGTARRRNTRERMAALEREEYMLPPVAGPWVDEETRAE